MIDRVREVRDVDVVVDTDDAGANAGGSGESFGRLVGRSILMEERKLLLVMLIAAGSGWRSGCQDRTKEVLYIAAITQSLEIYIWSRGDKPLVHIKNEIKNYDEVWKSDIPSQILHASIPPDKDTPDQTATERTDPSH